MSSWFGSPKAAKAEKVYPGKGKYWITDPSAVLDRGDVIGDGVQGYKPTTSIEVFRNTVTKYGSHNALHMKCREKDAEGKDDLSKPLPKEWTVWTWQQYYDDCMKFAKALIKLDVKMHKIVNIFGFNSPQWFIANNGSILCGSIAAGIYPTDGREACQFKSNHSMAEVIVIDSNKKADLYLQFAHELPHLKVIVMWDETPNADLISKFKLIKKDLQSWDDFMEVGRDIPDSAVIVRGDKIMPGHCSTLIYTSGTTGNAKAVMISHDNLTWTTRLLVEDVIDIHHKDRIVSYLPLSHIAAQILDMHGPALAGGQTYFAQKTDLSKGTIVDTLVDVQPTIFFGVPRVWEKFQEKMVAVGRSVNWALQKISAWAKGIGARKTEMNQFGADGGAPCCYGTANSLVFSKIKEKLGFTQVKAAFTAAAPISESTLRYFGSIDIPVYEVFGQSECTGPHTVSKEGMWKIGTCGRPIPGSLSKIDKDTGEIRYKGRHIFMGYMFMDDQTAETFDEDGYLRSGDQGSFDDDNHPQVPAPSGFMRITGRIKELIIGAGGENVAPCPIEDCMKTTMPAISNSVVVGDRQKFLAMLITLKLVPGADGVTPTNKLDKNALHEGNLIGSTATTVEEVIKCPKWKKYFDDGIDKANATAVSNAQRVAKGMWKILSDDFTEAKGELTPTQKLKRNVVVQHYEADIAEVYGKHWVPADKK